MKLFLTVFFAAFWLLALQAHFAGAFAGAVASCSQPYSGYGNWYISGNQTCENVSYLIQGNVTIEGNSRVLWRNVSLAFNTSYNGSNVLNVMHNAAFSVENSRIMSLNPFLRYYFQINEPSVFKLTDSEVAHAGNQDDKSPGRGIEIIFTDGVNKQVQLVGNYIHDGASGIVFSSYGGTMQTYVANNTIKNMEYNGVALNQVANSTIEGNVFDNIREHRGIMCSGCRYNLLTNNNFTNAPNGGGILIVMYPNTVKNSYFGKGLLHGVGVSTASGAVIENNVFEDLITNDSRAGVIDLLPGARNTTFRYNTIKNAKNAVTIFDVLAPNETDADEIEYNNFVNNTWNLRLPFGSRNKTALNNYWDSTNCSAIDSKLFDDEEMGGNSGKVLFEPFLNAPYPNGQSVGCNGAPRADAPLYNWTNSTLLHTDALHDASEPAYDLHQYHVADNATTLFFRSTFDSIAGGNASSGIAACGGSKGAGYRLSFLINNVKNQCVYFDIPEQYMQVDGYGNGVLKVVSRSDTNFLFGQSLYSVNYSVKIRVAVNCVTQSIDAAVNKADLLRARNQPFLTKAYTTNSLQGGWEEIKDIAPDNKWVEYPKK